MNLPGTLTLLFLVGVGFAMLFFHGMRVAGLSMMLFGVGAIAFFMWQTLARNSSFDELVVGISTRAEVEVSIGKPPRVTDGTESVEEGYRRNESELIPGCVAEYWYASFLYPQRLALCFDADDILIHKYRYQSW